MRKHYVMSNILCDLPKLHSVCYFYSGYNFFSSVPYVCYHLSHIQLPLLMMNRFNLPAFTLLMFILIYFTNILQSGFVVPQESSTTRIFTINFYLNIYSYVDPNQTPTAFADFSHSMVKQYNNNDVFVGDKNHPKPCPPGFEPPRLGEIFGVDMHVSCNS